jgi:pimeloyl-ACP methyl ester carboxylesterase
MTELTYSTVYVDGVRTAYLEAGSRENDTVLLIHEGGFGSSAELSWDKVIPELKDNYHVLAPDMLGWGGTAKVHYFDELPYPPKIRHIARLLEVLGIDEVFAAGNSFGGSLVLRAAITADNPWKISKAISIAGAGGLYRYPDGVEALTRFEPSMEESRRLTSLLVDKVEDFEDHVAARYEGSLVPGHWEQMMAPRLHNPAIDRTRLPDPFPEALGDLAIPVLYVEGLRDKLVEPDWASKLAEMTPRGLAISLDAGHAPNIEIPVETAQLFDDFFQERLS